MRPRDGHLGSGISYCETIVSLSLNSGTKWVNKVCIVPALWIQFGIGSSVNKVIFLVASPSSRVNNHDCV
ncbi:hypothetical protein ScPMuIL_012017 [Solemya velum]